MSVYHFKLPDIGEGTAEAEIVAWHVKIGDVVKEDQPLVEVMTDKATVELTSPVGGIVAELARSVGEKAAVGAVLVTFETVASATLPLKSSQGEARGGSLKLDALASQAKVEPPPGNASSATLTLASPAIRHRATEGRIDLTRVVGSGPGGRITERDLDAYRDAQPPRLTDAPNTRRTVSTRREGIHRIPVIGMRQQIAERMQLSKRHIPHFTYVEEVDMTALRHLRDHMNASRSPDQRKLTLLPFFMKAMAKAIPDFPQVNALYDDEGGQLHQYEGVHIGMATQTDNGLMVPVVRHVEAYALWSLAAEIARLATAARDGKAKREELSGSTITLTSMGALGGVMATPIINRPEVAIISPNRVVERPVVKGGSIQVRKIMNLGSSFDHRMVDGADAAAFIQRLKALLEMPATLFSE